MNTILNASELRSGMVIQYGAEILSVIEVRHVEPQARDQLLYGQR